MNRPQRSHEGLWQLTVISPDLVLTLLARCSIVPLWLPYSCLVLIIPIQTWGLSLKGCGAHSEQTLVQLKVYTSQSLKLRLWRLLHCRSNLLVQPLSYGHDGVELFHLFGGNGEQPSQLRVDRAAHNRPLSFDLFYFLTDVLDSKSQQQRLGHLWHIALEHQQQQHFTLKLQRTRGQLWVLPGTRAEL